MVYPVYPLNGSFALTIHYIHLQHSAFTQPRTLATQHNSPATMYSSSSNSAGSNDRELVSTFVDDAAKSFHPVDLENPDINGDSLDSASRRHRQRWCIAVASITGILISAFIFILASSCFCSRPLLIVSKILGAKDVPNPRTDPSSANIS